MAKDKPIPLDGAKARAHDIYNKHYVASRIYEYEDECLAQCSCGRWFWYAEGCAGWEQLVGAVARKFIVNYPDLYQPIKDHFESLNAIKGDSPPCRNWKDIEDSLPIALRTKHGAAKVEAKGDMSRQDGHLNETQAYLRAVTNAPISYPQPTSGKIWTSKDSGDDGWEYHKKAQTEEGT